LLYDAAGAADVDKIKQQISQNATILTVTLAAGITETQNSEAHFHICWMKRKIKTAEYFEHSTS